MGIISGDVGIVDNSRSLDFIATDSYTITFDGALSYEQSVVAAREFDAYRNNETSDYVLTTNLNKLSAVSIKVEEVDLLYYRKNELGDWTGDENLSEGAKLYVSYYKQQYNSFDNDYVRYAEDYLDAKASGNQEKMEAAMENMQVARNEMNKNIDQAQDIKYLDERGLVQGRSLKIPAYNQEPFGDVHFLVSFHG